MTTHEREITEPVALALPSGRRLNPAARGWSRHLVQTANQRGHWGRKKRWDYWSIQAGDLILSGVVADLDLAGLADVWWLDLSTMATGGRNCASVGGRRFAVPDLAGSVPIEVESRHLRVAIRDDDAGHTSIDASWTEPSGSPGELTAVIEMPAGHETLNVVIPWSDTVYQFTSKHQARPARGVLRVGDDRWEFGTHDDGWGVIDIGRGRWPYRTVWNWGGGAGLATDGSVIGLQLGGMWTVGTGATENGVVVDGRLSKIGRELDWTYDWGDPMSPWRVFDPGGQIDVTLAPRYDKYGLIDAKVVRRETHQVFGTWSGFVVDDAGVRHDVDGLHGFAEESRARW